METQVKKNTSQTLEPPISSSTYSSPSHDFSFTISNSKLPSTKTASSCPFAVDLSPADDIFFHGHLLPLHLLSHLPVSPRTSTGSFNDGFALPANDILPDQDHPRKTKTATEPRREGSEVENRVKPKPVKSFSLFSLPKWRKGLEGNEQKKKLLSLDLSHAVKKYIRMLFQKRENGKQFRSTRQPPPSSYSFSSSLIGSSRGNTKTIRGRRGADLFSAPASMRTSPTNSGHLRVSTAGLSSSSASTSSSSSDSTMEELQAAIQAAIAHCKNSSSSSSLDR